MIFSENVTLEFYVSSELCEWSSQLVAVCSSPTGFSYSSIVFMVSCCSSTSFEWVVHWL